MKATVPNHAISKNGNNQTGAKRVLHSATTAAQSRGTIRTRGEVSPDSESDESDELAAGGGSKMAGTGSAKPGATTGTAKSARAEGGGGGGIGGGGTIRDAPPRGMSEAPTTGRVIPRPATHTPRPKPLPAEAARGQPPQGYGTAGGRALARRRLSARRIALAARAARGEQRRGSPAALRPLKLPRPPERGSELQRSYQLRERDPERLEREE